MYKTNNIILDDCLIEVHFNSLLKNKPYLVRYISWDEKLELRLSTEELSKVSELINTILDDDINARPNAI
jgi:hypothetical protein